MGELLLPLDIRLYMLGRGDIENLNPVYVTHLGIVPLEECWNYLYHADVGVVVSAGAFQHNNESTKIYHYLRAGLPLVSESGFPNEYLLEASGIGTVVESGNLNQLAERLGELAWHPNYNRQSAIDYILQHYTWDQRIKTYDQLFKKHFPSLCT